MSSMRVRTKRVTGEPSAAVHAIRRQDIPRGAGQSQDTPCRRASWRPGAPSKCRGIRRPASTGGAYRKSPCRPGKLQACPTEPRKKATSPNRRRRRARRSAACCCWRAPPWRSRGPTAHGRTATRACFTPRWAAGRCCMRSMTASWRSFSCWSASKSSMRSRTARSRRFASRRCPSWVHSAGW